MRAEEYDDGPSFQQLAKAACLALLSFMLMLRSFSRPFSTSLSRAFPRHIPAGPTAQGDGDIPPSLEQAAQTEGLTAEDFEEANEGKRVQWTLDDIVENDNDSSSAGHLYLAQQRQNLHYLRLIEHEMPKLVGECSSLARVFSDRLTQANTAFRKPFIPPTSKTPLVVRSMSYGGEEHPATVKRVLTVAVSQLPLKDERAIHKFCLLAGVRWSPTPPKDAGIKPGESAEHGYVKISCEDFPEPAMNLKWVSDRLDDLIKEANVRSFYFPSF